MIASAVPTSFSSSPKALVDSRPNHAGIRYIALFALLNAIALLIPLGFLLGANTEAASRLSGLFFWVGVPATLSLASAVGLYLGKAWGCTVLCLRDLLGLFAGGTTLLASFDRWIPCGVYNELVLQISELLLLAWLTWEFWRVKPKPVSASEIHSDESLVQDDEQAMALPSTTNPVRPWGTVVAFVLVVIGFTVWLTEVRFYRMSPSQLVEIPVLGPSLGDLHSAGPLLATGVTRQWGRVGQWAISGQATESEIRRFAKDHLWTTASTNSTSKASSMARKWNLNPVDYPSRMETDFIEVHAGRLPPPWRGVGVLIWRERDGRFCLEAHVLGRARETTP